MRRNKSYYQRLANAGVAALLFWFALLIFQITGWFMNVYTLFHMHEILNGEGALRIAGIFVPLLGPVMGWFF